MAVAKKEPKALKTTPAKTWQNRTIKAQNPHQTAAIFSKRDARVCACAPESCKNSGRVGTYRRSQRKWYKGELSLVRTHPSRHHRAVNAKAKRKQYFAEGASPIRTCSFGTEVSCVIS